MNELFLLVGLIALLVLALAVVVIIQNRKEQEIRKNNPGYPQEYFINQGVAMGVAFGAGIGVALDNIALGVGIGIALGAAVGFANEKKHKDEIRPLLEEEKKLRKQSLLMIAGVLVLGIAVFLLAYFLRR